MDAGALSQNYAVRRLTEGDAEQILSLCRTNEIFYRYHPPEACLSDIMEDMTALPPGKSAEDKLYVGFYREDDLTAIADIILDYPQNGTVFLGLFMVDGKYQGRGVGSAIISEMRSAFKEHGFTGMRLAVDDGNPQSRAFWINNGFSFTGERKENGEYAYLPMEAEI